ncbi:MAG: hydrogenase formation protein HypD [Deltaproteobacteria bacterium]|nr:hydrogenase formation protein HypD [Deltaproteobacteria bacterium]MBW2084903.1 hydrogenase formation protein HypD [Deltaproteobacteria bacterium]
MNFLDQYRNPEMVRRLADRIHQRSTRPVRLMEFCGGHTVAIMKNGIRQLVPPQVQLLSGPGCPVCVTATADLNKAIGLARLPEVIVVTFGDLLKVPGSDTSLEKVRAEGGDVRVVYSVQDALGIAQKDPEKSVVFIGIGFETTAPTIAASILEAERRGMSNYYVLSLHKLCPPVMKALLDSKEVRLDGIICPGHVSTIIGSRPYEFISRDYGIACVVSGFEPLDILQCIEMLVKQIESGQPKVENAYPRAVRPEGNKEALKIMESVFEVSNANWRGLGEVADSGLRLKDEYRAFDAEEAFEISQRSVSDPEGCICGEILRGIKTPLDCKLFGKGCLPDHPVGPCMVSSEGSCAAYFQYGATSHER